jgi:Na+/melibiose symporter-like transporter
MSEGGNRRLSRRERGFVGVLGVPMLGITLAVTTVSAYLPVLLEELSGPAVIGVLIGLEGLFALILPALIGAWSDRIESPIGRRLPFLLAAAAIATVALLLLPALGDSLALMAIALALFFVGYHLYTVPYWALYPDLVPDPVRGRSVGSMGFWRAIGMGAALTGGGVMLAAWEPLPFVVAAAVLAAATGVFIPFAIRHESRGERAPAHGGRLLDGARSLLARDRRIAAVLAANALWEAGVGALRAFAVLFLTVGLGHSLETVSVVMAAVAVTALAAAPVAGTLADRWGELRLLRFAVVVFGVGLLLPLVTTSTVVVAAIPVIAFAAVTVMTLPLSLLMGVLPPSDHGSAAGLFAMSRGAGLLAGPLAAGIAITLLEPVFPGTDGYAAMFAVASLAVLASLPLIAFLRRTAGSGDRG